MVVRRWHSGFLSCWTCLTAAWAGLIGLAVVTEAVLTPERRALWGWIVHSGWMVLLVPPASLLALGLLVSWLLVEPVRPAPYRG